MREYIYIYFLNKNRTSQFPKFSFSRTISRKTLGPLTVDILRLCFRKDEADVQEFSIVFGLCENLRFYKVLEIGPHYTFLKENFNAPLDFKKAARLLRHARIFSKVPAHYIAGMKCKILFKLLYGEFVLNVF